MTIFRGSDNFCCCFCS
uniref:Uncharacterized protein n=1 Tax=Rhizophora mucronata TaxID=61149 RepID=A0A2P2QZS5_RHIMU